MFGKQQRIEELERALKSKDIEIDDLKRDVATLKLEKEDLMRYIEDMDILQRSIPEDCIRGAYCAACTFSKHYYIRSGFSQTEVVLCNKAGGCKNFVQEEPR